jgi:hypothetical protein
MNTHPTISIEPWAEYRGNLTPLTDKAALGRVLGSRIEDNPGTYDGFKIVFERLNVGFFLYAHKGRYEFHLVQLGEDIPDCERLIFWRQGRERASGNTRWYTNPEHFRDYIDNDTLLMTLFQERQRRLLHRGVEPTPIAEQVYWQLYKLTNEREDEWRKGALHLQSLHDRGHSWADLHDMLFHYPHWLKRHHEFTDMPRELVIRTHGLGGTLQMLGPHSAD